MVNLCNDIMIHHRRNKRKSLSNRNSGCSTPPYINTVEFSPTFFTPKKSSSEKKK
ncbi:unnamed protein product [Cunninghamella blakesleeana]